MLTHRIGEDRGQTLVTVALSMFALLMVIGVAVEVGHIYQERRHMQNAADAAALAGAREICAGHGAGAAMDAATGYVKGLNRSPLGEFVTAQVNIDRKGDSDVVTVTATERMPLFFGLFGMSTTDVPAVAAALCGPASTPCGLWPVTIEDVDWEQVAGDCGKKFVLWADSPGDLDCDEWDCDFWGDAEDDILFAGNRGYLDFAEKDPLDPVWGDACTPNCGQILSCRIRNDYPATVQIPGCVLGEPGVVASALMAAQDRADLPDPYDVVRIPIHDGSACNPDEPVAGGECGGWKAYHVIGAACVKIEEADFHFEICKKVPPEHGPQCQQNHKVIIASVYCGDACNPTCAGSNGGTGIGASSVRGVSLIR